MNQYAHESGNKSLDQCDFYSRSFRGFEESYALTTHKDLKYPKSRPKNIILPKTYEVYSNIKLSYSSSNKL